ncbi:sensor histidine kinase [Achromobacter arsenitoxydans]|uniref:histidine kinase n=1 Tax=Achromobacter arsenitoxydans SY8 TaxID=477184 RepID=H0FFA5_9BURK|nr:sensor histidine kinase [Achromobacter arsenitoxydans]EHK62997.1 histidine kinase [Achromobacter arsenitoxydans SY8]
MKRKYYPTAGVWLALLACVLAGVLAVAGQARAEPLRLDGRDRIEDAGGHLERLYDPDGSLDAAGAAMAGGWTALPSNLSAGFTPATVWLRLPVQVDEVPQGGWMLRLSNSLLDDVRVYVSRSAGNEAGNAPAWTLLGRSGEDVARRDWPVDYRSPVIQFNPAQAGSYVILVRLQSKNAMATRLEVWQRLAFDNQSRREGLLFGLYFGFYLLLICAHAVFWLVTRAPMSGLFLAYIGNCVFNEVLSLGLVQQLTGLPVQWSDRLLGVGICFSLPIALRIAFRQLNLAALYPRAVRWIEGVFWAIAIGCALLVVSGRYGMGMQPVQSLALLVIVGFTVLAAYLLKRGWRPARFFALAFGVFYLSVLIAFLRNLGVLPVNAFTEYVSTLGTMLHMLLLSLFIVGRYERQRRIRELQQANLAADLARQHSHWLEREVALRTAEMQGEIERRVALEGELRTSLDKERRMFVEQREFVAMVSHEFRTPLAIITTSAQQLGRNLTAPVEKSLARCANIRDAAMRLLALVDEYLTDDRMREPRAALRMTQCELPALLADLASEYPPGRIQCAYEPADPGRHVLDCDAGMLRIALRNLLANADRHCAEGGAVRVAVREEGELLHIAVSNPGSAIPPADQERLFQKYYRGQNALRHPGAGLGLYLVSSIAQRLGGAVSLTSAGGNDPVCFSLSLPQRRPV